jgi:hypothetical protein
MINKFKNIAALILLVVFLLPSIVKLEHHHKHFICNAKNEKHYHTYHERCEICNFEFSVFSSEIKNSDLQKEQILDNYCNNYCSEYYSNHHTFSFLLRAPPV